MLTPDTINLLEFNDVVKLYEKLNVEITSDIIRRIQDMEDISASSRWQLKKLLETNGADIFKETVERVADLTQEQKKEIVQVFDEMAKQNMKDYKELYNYRDKPFKISAGQYKILDANINKTSRLLKNMTKTVAFESERAYVETVDNAYLKAQSGAFDYQSAINSAVDELASKGITLQDKLGRNVQLETAVRRNVLMSLQDTSNYLNKEIAKELDCDGWEVTAHSGARDTHAEAQGKQYAINKDDAKKFGVGLWSDVEDLWQEYNCRHTYFGIILGISEPMYNKKELDEFKNAKVTYQGKEISYYEGTQKQRQYENAIRKTKRTIEIKDNANMDTTTERMQLKNLQNKYNNLCKETGLEKDYSRTRVSKTLTNTNIKSNINKITYKELSEDEFFELSSKHRKSISETIRKSIYKSDWDNMQELNKYGYINSNYSGEINKLKRTGEVGRYEKQFRKTVDNLEKAIAINKLEDDIEVVRYLDLKYLSDKIDNAVYKEILKGNYKGLSKELLNKEYIDNQFISTTANPEFNNFKDRPIKMILDVKKGTNAFVTENLMEREIIFDSSKINVKEIYVNNENKIIMLVDLGVM